MTRRALLLHQWLVLLAPILAAMTDVAEGASLARVSVSLGTPGVDGSFGYSYGYSSGNKRSDHFYHHAVGPYDNVLDDQQQPFRHFGPGRPGPGGGAYYRRAEAGPPIIDEPAPGVLVERPTEVVNTGPGLPPPPDPPFYFSGGFRPNGIAFVQPPGIPPPLGRIAPYPAGAKRPPVETNLLALNYDASKQSGYSAARDAFFFAKNFYPQALAFTRKAD